MTAHKDGKREIEVEYKITPAEPTLLQKAAWEKFWEKMLTGLDRKISGVPDLPCRGEDNG